MAMRMPIYQPQVAARPGGAPPEPVQISPEASRRKTAAAQAIGQSLMRMGDVLADRAVVVAKNRAALSYHKLGEEAERWREQMLELKGENAAGLYEAGQQKWQELADRYGSELSGPARRNFDDFVQAKRAAFLGGLTRHELREMQAVAYQTADLNAASEVDTLVEAIDAGDPIDHINEALVGHRLEQQGMGGHSPEWVQAKLKQDRNQAASRALSAALDRRDWGNARRILEDFGPQEDGADPVLTREQTAVALSKIEAGTKRQAIVQFTDEIWAEHRAQGPAGLEAALEAVRSRVPADLRYEVEQAVERQFAQDERAKAQAIEARGRELMGRVLEDTTSLDEALAIADDMEDPVARAALYGQVHRLYGTRYSGDADLGLVQSHSDEIWNDERLAELPLEQRAQAMIAAAEAITVPHLRQAVIQDLMARLSRERALGPGAGSRQADPEQRRIEEIERTAKIHDLMQDIERGEFNGDRKQMINMVETVTRLGGGPKEVGDALLARDRAMSAAVPIMDRQGVEAYIERTLGSIPPHLSENMGAIYGWINEEARRQGMTKAGEVQHMIAELLVPDKPGFGFGFARHPHYLLGLLATDDQALGEWRPDAAKVSGTIRQTAQQIFADRSKNPNLTLLGNAKRVALLNQHYAREYARMDPTTRGLAEFELAKRMREESRNQDITPHIYEVVRFARVVNQVVAERRQEQDRRASRRQAELQAEDDELRLLPPQWQTALDRSTPWGGMTEDEMEDSLARTQAARDALLEDL